MTEDNTPQPTPSLAELLEGMEAGDTLPIDQTFENAPPAGNEVL